MSTALTPYIEPQGVTLVDIRLDSTRFPRLKNLHAQSAMGSLEQVILLAYSYTGRPAPEDRCNMVAAALYNELLADKKGIGTGNITIPEIAHAVKTAILEATEDVYINIAFLYKAVCRYALGEGHEAQESANRRRAAERQQALEKTPAGAMLTAYAGAMLQQTKNTAKR